MKVLVTGASGMLGGATARALADRGDQVTVLQRRPSGLGLTEVLADVSDRDALRAAVAGHDAVIHLAAKVDVVGDWVDFKRINISGTLSVVDACRATGVTRLVHVSTPSVAHAGSSLVGVPAGVADFASARGYYARSKALAEQVALRPTIEGLPVVAVRPHIVWGPGDTQLVARIVDRARRGRMPLIGTGAVLVDSTYVSNATDALLAALDHCPEVAGQALVVTNGEPRPIAELIGGMCDAAGVPRPTRRVPVPVAAALGSVVESLWARRYASRPAPSDPPLTRFVVEQLSTAHWFDQRHTRQVLDWSPRVSLDEGFAELARSFRR